MLALDIRKHILLEKISVRPSVLAEEASFYDDYGWCLNPHLTVAEAFAHLGKEAEKLSNLTVEWQRREVSTNIYLLACAILNTVDEHLRGKSLRLSGPLGRSSAVRGLKFVADLLGGALPRRNVSSVRRWREGWVSALGEFLAVFASPETCNPHAIAVAAGTLGNYQPPPAILLTEHIGIPSPYQRLDLTHFDVLALARRLIERLPNRHQPILLIGLRTSGSYFAPLMKAVLEGAGYGTVALATIEPNKGADRWEMDVLRRFASQGFTGVIVDDPPHSGGTVLVAHKIARRAGFDSSDLYVVAPTHPANRDWPTILPDNFAVMLQPEQWHKQELSQAGKVEAQLSAYFGGKNCSVLVVESERADRFTTKLQSTAADERVARLKRVYEVHLKAGRATEVIFVLAKSVGWGWLGYHAFIAARRLAGLVPPLFGLRDGILYTQYIPSTGEFLGRRARIDAVSDYVAARVRSLGLSIGQHGAIGLKRYNNGLRLLEKSLSRGFGCFVTNVLMRPQVSARLCRQPCPSPTWIDGNMQQSEWIGGAEGYLKTDYEHHGMGKGALNVVDPAYDLADAILDLELSGDEESSLIERYRAKSGDAAVGQRLFLNKLLAGIWNMNQAQEQLCGKARDRAVQAMAHQRFVNAWNFLTVETARYCGRSYKPTKQIGWRAPLILLDVDGVIDQRLFGFPATTAAGVQALAKLTSHDCSVALNTARSVGEVKDYCAAYSLAGGIAEYGSYLWDAVNSRGQVLIDSESAGQIETLREALRQIPGVFLDERHLYSIRAFTYRAKPDAVLPALLRSIKRAEIGDGAVAPVAPQLIKQLMNNLGLDRLRVFQTTIDTTIVARDVDKGVGLSALRDWVLAPGCETIAVGDGEADLAMFRVANRSFAPGNIRCARRAQALGCEIVPQYHQNGFLEIARRITGVMDRANTAPNNTLSGHNEFMAEIFSAADRSWMRNFLGALRHPSMFKTFFR